MHLHNRVRSQYNVKATARFDMLMLGTPAMFAMTAEYAGRKGIATIAAPDLRIISSSGAPLEPEIKRTTEQLFGLPLHNGYGITECSPGISGVRLDAPRTDNAVGVLLPGVEARIRSADGTPLGNGEVGELHVRGPNVMRGYYRAPELTAQAIDGEGWFNTGDLARFEGDCLYIVGRTKEMIIRSGFNVYPAEVEAVLNSHQDVVQSAVVGRPADGNEEVVAFVQMVQGSKTGAQDLLDFLKGQLAAYKRPSEIILLDAMPASSTGKILKHKLAQSLREVEKSAAFS